jgi:hypothetical protein
MKNQKKLVIIVLTALTAITAICLLTSTNKLKFLTLSGTTETLVRVNPQTNIYDVNETFTVNIEIVNVTNLFGLEIDIRWDNSTIKLLSRELLLGVQTYPEGVLYEPLYIFYDVTEGNRYWIVASSMYQDTPSFNGTGIAFRLNFQVIKEGETLIWFYVTKLADKPEPGEASEAIPHTTIDGYFKTPDKFGYLKVLGYSNETGIWTPVEFKAYYVNLEENVKSEYAQVPITGYIWTVTVGDYSVYGQYNSILANTTVTVYYNQTSTAKLYFIKVQQPTGYEPKSDIIVYLTQPTTVLVIVIVILTSAILYKIRKRST